MKNTQEYQCNGSKNPHPYSVIYISPSRNLPNGCIQVREIAVCTNCLAHNQSKSLPINHRAYLHIIDPSDKTHPIPTVDESVRQKFESYSNRTVEEIAQEAEILSISPRPRLEISSTSRKGPDESWFSPGKRRYNYHLKYQKHSSQVAIPSKPSEFD